MPSLWQLFIKYLKEKNGASANSIYPDRKKEKAAQAYSINPDQRYFDLFSFCSLSGLQPCIFATPDRDQGTRRNV